MKFCEKFHGIELKVVLFGLPIFFAVLSGVKSDCNYFQDLEPGQTYYVTNPGFPNNYQGEQNCTWQATSPYNTIVNCTVDMPPSDNCYKDSLSIQFAGSEAKKYCGNGNIALEGINPTIKFVSPPDTPGGRFICSLVTERRFDEYNCPCGWKKPTKITNGNETGVNEYTMMAGMVDINRREIYCGATIISDQFVLTAAHCMLNKNINDIGVVVGEHDVTTGKETSATKLYRVSGYVTHPLYDEKYHNDIAICKIIGVITYSAEVGPVCLPFQHQFDSFGGDFVTLLGWGLEEFGGTKATTLQEVEDISIMNEKYCKDFYPDMTYNNMCSFNKQGKDACQMDSGGPLLWQNPTTNRLVQVGIIIGGVGCGGGDPSINTRVGGYVNWIQEITGVQYCKVE